MNKLYHKPVMVNKIIEYLSPSDDKIYVDATFGSGGHTKAILESSSNCKVISIDIDQNAINLNSSDLKENYPERFNVFWGNFTNITNFLKSLNISKIDGLLADFGTSQYQIKNNPGLSFKQESKLDMRLSPSHTRTTAYTILNNSTESELCYIFYKFGQESNSKNISKAIVNYRKNFGIINTTKELVNIIESVSKKSGNIHPATKVFQALRIVINDELNSIKSLLAQSTKLLNKNGRLVCISFHSLEDSIVKQFLKENKENFKTLTNHVVIPEKEEIDKNRSSRSSKLRAALKI